MLYDYYCDKHESKHEVIFRNIYQRMEDPPPTCPDCGKPMERLYDNQSVSFRGLTTPGRKD